MLCCAIVVGIYSAFAGPQEHFHFWLHTTFWFLTLALVERIVRFRIMHEVESPVQDASDLT